MDICERMDTVRKIKEAHEVLCKRHNIDVKIIVLPMHLLRMYFLLIAGGKLPPMSGEGFLKTKGPERTPDELVIGVDGHTDPGFIFCHEWHHIVSLLKTNGRDAGDETSIEGPDKIAEEFGFKKTIESAREGLKAFVKSIAKEQGPLDKDIISAIDGLFNLSNNE